MKVPIGACLQCEQTPAQVRENQTICGIEGGYEYIELEAEWPRHHWRDWSDVELRKSGIKPDAYESHRRTAATSLQYAPCDEQINGHRGAAEDSVEFGLRVDQCIFCGYTIQVAQ